MRFFQSWIRCAATIFCFLLLLLVEPHGGCRASHLQSRNEGHAPVPVSSDRSSPEPIIIQTSEGQQLDTDGLQHPVNPPIRYNNELSTLTQQKGKQNEERRIFREPKNAEIVASRWVRDHHYQNMHGRHQYLQLVSSILSAVAAKEKTEIFPFKEVDEIILSKLSLSAAQAEATSASGCAGAISEGEYQALQDLYLATGGANWTWHNISSSSGESQWVFPGNLTAPCADSWEGVYCTPYRDPLEPSVNCGVSGLVLPFTGLRGQLPASIASLLQLEILSLQTNHLGGTIPTSLSNLAALSSVALYGNSLTGPIPSSLGDLIALTQLYLDENLLTGPIPSSLGKLKSLAGLYLSGNSLIGPIPSSLGDLAALTLLGLYENSLTGPIPSSLGQLNALTGLSLYGNKLIGPIPSAIGNLKALTLLVLFQNSLEGPIPSSLGNLGALTLLSLYRNSLTGRIPSSLGDLTALTQLYLDANSLTGPIPSSLGQLRSVSEVYLNGNSLTGSIPSSLGQLRALTQLNMSSNSIISTIPSSLGLLEKCFYINMSSNSITGSVPPEVGYVGSNLTLSDKLLVVRVALDLSQNALTGTLPPLLFSQQMQTILLNSNCMRGSLPAEICSSSNLQTLVLDKLTSGSSCQSKVLGFQSTFAATTLQGSIPECVWSMSMLHTLHLSGNALHGTLGDIGSISSLTNVDLSNNFLTGSIPTSLQEQQTLQQLDLGNNKLSGTLSPSFVVGNLTLLTLAVNRLSGGIPSSFANTPTIANFSVLTGNLFACGSFLPTADPASSSYICGSETLNIALYISGSALFVLVLLAVVTYIHLTRFDGVGCAPFDNLLKEGIDYLTHHGRSVLKAPSLRQFDNVVETLKSWLCALGFCYLGMATPAYAVLKSAASAGILAEQYTWITTSAFLHGYTSAALVGLFVLFSGLFLVLFVQRLDSLLKHTVADSPTSQLSPADSQHFQLRNILQRVLIQTVSLVVVLVVNVFYVYGVVLGGLSASEQVLTLTALGLFKVLWQQLVVTYAISWIAKNHDDISVGGLIFHQAVMNLVSFIVAPCLATLGTDSNCLYYALVGLQPISSSFNITLVAGDCVTTTYPNGDSRTNCVDYPYQQSTAVSISPPWFYSYQCTSALLATYIPALLIMFATSAIAIPLLQLTLITMPRDFDRRSAFLKYLPKQSPPSCRKPVADILLDLLVLMTFGLASPLLGVMIVVKQITTALLARILFGRYLQQAEDPTAALTAVEDAAQQFRGGDTRALLGFLLVVVGIFWGAMIFDMVADLHGNTAGGIAWAVTFAVWTTSAALAFTFAGRIRGVMLSISRVFTGRQDVTDKSGDFAVPLTANAHLIFDGRERISGMGCGVATSMSTIFPRVSGDDVDMSTPSAEVGRSSLVLAESKNIIITSEIAGVSWDDDRVDIQRHNSAFGEGRNSELELI